MMKILHVGKFYPVRGGVEKVMFDIATGISEHNGVVCDILCASTDRVGRIINCGNTKVICTPTLFSLFATMISPGMISALRKMCGNYELIHIHHPDPMAALALWFSRYEGKVVLHWHSDILKQKVALKFYSPLQKWLINRADVIVGTTPKYLQCSPFLQNPSLKKECIPIGIDTLKWDVGGVERLKKMYPDKKIVFSLGRLVSYKGFEYLIGAATYLPDEYMVLIGGSGPLKQRLSDLILKNKVGDKVKLLGRIPDEELPQYYAACGVYVLSSIWKTEAFGIVQIEAMSCGKPVVATQIDGSGVDWVNEDGVSGLNVPTENSKAIADAILYLTSNEERYKRFSIGAKQRYETFFRKDLMIKKCLDLYTALLA